MYWRDEGYLLSKNNFNENSIIMEAFTLHHGKCSGVVYGGSSKKNKKIFQIGNKISIIYKSKNENSKKKEIVLNYLLFLFKKILKSIIYCLKI